VQLYRAVRLIFDVAHSSFPRWSGFVSPGVTRLNQNGGVEPARVPDRIIDGLRARERGGLFVLPPPPFQPGNRVRITHGPLVGFSGLVAGMRPHQRIEILLQMLGRVELVATAVERIA
jgi:transcriptional antiterminator RfaH